MEDTLSVKSNESIATSDEFEYIGGDKPAISKTPTLDVKNGDLNQLKINLTDALKESCIGMSMHPEHFSNNDNEPENELKNEERSESNVFPMDLENTAARGENISRKNSSERNCEKNLSDTGKKVGHSTFYGCIVEPGKDPLTSQDTKDFTASNPTSDEKKDSEKLDSCCEDYYYQEVSDVDQDCTIFSGVTYLGAANINAPKSECEIQRNMAILNEQSCESGAGGIKVSVSVPCSSQGFVVLYDALSNSVISRYEIHRILFYARGPVDSPESGCFAFTWSHGDTQESAIFQCHIFKCDIAEAVSRVSACFAKAFQRVPRSMSSSVHSSVNAADLMSGSITTLPDVARTLMYVFEVNLEIKEDDGKGTFSAVGKDKNGFKLKTNTEKQLCLSIRQVSDNGPQLHIERCFGILIAPGRHVRHSDMQLLEMDQTSSNSGTSAATTTATNPHTEKTSASNNGNNSNSNSNNGATSNLTQVSASWDPTEASFEALNTETAKDQKQYMTVAVDLVIRGIQEPVRFQMETAVRIVGQNELRNFWYFQRKSLVQQFYLNLKEVVSPDLNDIYYEVLSMETSGELDRNLLNLNLNLSSLIQSPSITSIDTITPSKEEYSSDGDEPLLSGTGLVSKDCSEDVLESWADVLNKWKLTRQPPKQLSGLVRLGIPEALRGEVWQRLAGVEENNEIMENYRLLITKESSCENVIKRDIARTFPAHDFFKEAGGLGQDSLYRVSKAYAVYDSEVGYCQGLSFLAATLLLHMPEEQAFCVLVKLMYDYGLRDLYKDGFDNLYLRLHQLNCLMEEQLAVLWQHFKDHHVETHMFASQWFLTLFTARFPLYFVFHIIDVVLLQGIETLFQVALALLMLCKKDLLQLDFEGILKYFRVSLPKKCRTEESAKQLIKLACNIKVKKLKKYEADFIAHKDKAETEEKMRQTLVKYEEEKKWMQEKIQQLKKQADQAEMEKKNSQIIINDYKLVRQRLDAQLTSVKNELDELKAKISNCENCGKYTAEEKPEKMQNQLLIKNDDGLERVRELELELAQTKLAHVEAECKNQDLIHQLRSTELELTTAKNSWPPWLSKTLSSIKEVANKKDFSNFPPLSTQQNNHHSNTNHQSNSNAAPTFVSHINQSVMSRRESAPSNIINNNAATLPQVTRPAPPLISTKSQSFAENSKQQLKKSARNFCENKNANFDRKNDVISQRSSSLKDRKSSARDDQSRRRDSATLPAGAPQQTSSVGRAVSSHGTTNLGIDSTVVKNSSVIIKDSQSVSSSLKSASAQN